MRHLYTVICEYDGGTYIAQEMADSPKGAVHSWLDRLGSKDRLPRQLRKQLQDDLNEDPPIAVDECDNVWCYSASSEKGLVLINVVLTASETEKVHKGL